MKTDFIAAARPPAAVAATLRAACYDCHSHETRWPWYSRLAPVSWLIASDVNEGREHLNLSDWPAEPARAAKNLDRMNEVIDYREMPPRKYTLLHSAARLDESQRKEILDWTAAAAEQWRGSHQPSRRMLHTELIPAAEKNSRRIFVVLHGLGDSIEGWRWLPAALDLPWLNYLLVNAPDEYFGGCSWFDYPGDIAPGIHRSRRLLFELLDDLQAKGFPADQITLGGFSQGCLMSIETGLHYPHRLAGIVGISGWVFEMENLSAT